MTDFYTSFWAAQHNTTFQIQNPQGKEMKFHKNDIFKQITFIHFKVPNFDLNLDVCTFNHFD